MIFMVCAYSLTSNSIIWKRLGCGRFYLPVSSYGYTHDVLLHQPCMCNNNDRAARLIKFPITDTASCKTKKLSIFSAKSTFLIFQVFQQSFNQTILVPERYFWGKNV